MTNLRLEHSPTSERAAARRIARAVRRDGRKAPPKPKAPRLRLVAVERELRAVRERVATLETLRGGTAKGVADRRRLLTSATARLAVLGAERERLQRACADASRRPPGRSPAPSHAGPGAPDASLLTLSTTPIRTPTRDITP